MALTKNKTYEPGPLLLLKAAYLAGYIDKHKLADIVVVAPNRRLQAENGRLPTANCQLPTGNCKRANAFSTFSKTGSQHAGAHKNSP